MFMKTVYEKYITKIYRCYLGKVQSWSCCTAQCNIKQLKYWQQYKIISAKRNKYRVF